MCLVIISLLLRLRFCQYLGRFCGILWLAFVSLVILITSSIVKLVLAFSRQPF